VMFESSSSRPEEERATHLATHQTKVVLLPAK